MLRLIWGTASALVVVILLTACGSQQEAAPREARGNHDASGQSLAGDFARAVNLTDRDVAGATALGEESAVAQNSFDVSLSRCGGGLPGWEVGSIDSANLQQPARGQILMSAVHVVASCPAHGGCERG
jgi:hypothetical protein